MQEKIQKLIAGVQEQSDSCPKKCLVGFDGFIDTILSAVDVRQNRSTFSPIATLDHFGKRIASFAHQSGNIECVEQKKKRGGNGPLFSEALLVGKHAVTLIGTLGAPSLDPLFLPLAKECERVISLGECAQTDALEFEDGKLILGKHASLLEVTAERCFSHLSLEEWRALFSSLDLFASVNWTMLPEMHAIWKYLLEHILPFLQRKKKDKPFLFIDFSDPGKRPEEECRQAFCDIDALSKYYAPILSMNWSEAMQLGKQFISTLQAIPPTNSNAKRVGAKIVKTMLAQGSFSHVVIHHAQFIISGTAESLCCVIPPFCSSPLVKTGAGDHFNGGFCHALLSGLSCGEAAIVGSALAGSYIRRGETPAMADLLAFLSENEWTTFSLDLFS